MNQRIKGVVAGTAAGLAGVAALAAGAAKAGGADSSGAAVRARATASAIGFMGSLRERGDRNLRAQGDGDNRLEVMGRARSNRSGRCPPWWAAFGGPTKVGLYLDGLRA